MDRGSNPNKAHKPGNYSSFFIKTLVRLAVGRVLSKIRF
jgi:hypothetical protein